MNRTDNTNLAESIGSVIKELRQKKYPNHGGQIKCAQDFGVSQAEWSRWERGIKIPSPQNQRAIADFFNVSIAQLYGENYTKEVPNSQANSILNLYRKVADINTLLTSLVQKAEQNTPDLPHTLKTLESLRSSLEVHLDNE